MSRIERTRARRLAWIAACALWSAPAWAQPVPQRPAPPCSPGATAATEAEPPVDLVCLAEGVWVFTALAPADFTYPGYPANGLLVDSEAGSVLVDTGWTPAQAESLAVFGESRGRPIVAAVATHFHNDRVGGTAALAARAIPVFATAQTIALARAAGEPVPTHELGADSLPGLQWLHPGAGHSSDNLVVWHPASRTLFGGCLVKDLAAESLGNVADAELWSWPSAIRVSWDVGAPAFVVPGHGVPGGEELLAHTLELLGARECVTAAECVVTIEALDGCACCGCVAPRAMSLAAIEAARANLLSCQPICEGRECPPCTPPEELSRLAAECRQAQCVLAP